MTNAHKQKVKRYVMQGWSNQEIVNKASKDRWNVFGRELYFQIENIRESLSVDGRKDPIPRLAKVTSYHDDEMDYGAEFKFEGSFSVSETIILNRLSKGFVYEDKRKLSKYERELC